MPDLINLEGDGGKCLLCYTRRKRSRDATPLVGAEEKQQPEPRSLDALPDECLYEILRRLPGNRERSISACVSRRWLMLLSGIRPPKSSLTDEEEIKNTGCLTRHLEGRVTDVTVAAVAVGTAGRGGLGILVIMRLLEQPNPGLTDLGISAVAQCCPCLEDLTIWSAPNVTDAGLAELARGCPMIEFLDLCGCPLLTGKGLLAVAEKFHSLVSIMLQSCVGIGDEGLQAIGCCSLKLQSVQIEDCPLIGDQGIAAMMCSASSTLVTLMLQNLNVSDLALDCIGHYGKAVTKLHLTGLQNVSERGFCRMGNAMGLQKLESIVVTDCRGVTAAGLAAVATGCPGLKRLSLCNCRYVSDDRLMAFIESAHALENLQLEKCDRITLVGVLASLVNRSAKIETLGLVRCLGIKDTGSCPDGLPVCESLQTLTIHGCPGFTSANLAVVGKICPSLTRLELGDLVGVTDVGIEGAAASLEYVDLQGCANITDPAVCALVQQHGDTLQVLNLAGCNKLTDRALLAISEHCNVLEDLDMSGADITDYGVAHLASARHLNVSDLSFEGCDKLTPRILPLLGKMGLERLNIRHCNLISELDIASLREKMWGCDMD